MGFFEMLPFLLITIWAGMVQNDIDNMGKQGGTIMNVFIGNYYIETGYGFDTANATVTEVKGTDAYGRAIMGACVFTGTWDECVKYAKTH